MKLKKIRFLFAGCEVLCLLCFAALILPVGQLYRVGSTICFLHWVLLLYLCATLLLVWLAVFWRWRHKHIEIITVVLTFLLSFQISFYLFKQAIYWKDMFALAFVSDATTAVRYGICCLFCTIALLGLGIWGFFLRRASKSEQT